MKLKTPKQVLMEIYGVDTEAQLVYWFSHNDKSLKMACDAMEAYAEQFKCYKTHPPKNTQPEPVLVPVNNYNQQIMKGDILVITPETAKGGEQVKVKKIKFTNDGVEIILDKNTNRFFNLDKYLIGESWVKKVYVLRYKGVGYEPPTK